MAEGPLVVLSGAGGRTFIETGLVAIRDSHTRLFAKRPVRSERDTLNNITVHHEWVHYLQSLTCAAVQFEAQQMLRLSAAVISEAAGGAVSDATHEEFAALTERLGRPADEPIRTLKVPEGQIIVPIPERDQLGMLDLMEGVAVLESFKLCTKNARVEDFLRFCDRYVPGSETSVYRRSFDWLARDVGLEGAYELLGPVSFFALQSQKPTAEFVRLTKLLSANRKIDPHALTSVEAFVEFAYDGEWKSWLHGFEHGEPEAGHMILDKCATFVVGVLGVKDLTQFGATPSRVTQESFLALQPPVTVYSGDERLVLTVPKYARGELAEMVLNLTAMVGAAERLTTRAETDVYQFCPHRASCPHFESALCHRYFASPGVKRSHENCVFPAVFRNSSNIGPDELWSRLGRARVSVRELVDAFESEGEAGLWALARRQRASIVAWLGEEGYAELEWKCKATAEKTMRALQTQKMTDLMEAQAFRDAIVREVRNRAAERGD
jgi:hypothetical protein